VALGGEALTFAGLAGMGDLVATCISRHSRNRYVGEQLGRGRPPAQIVTDMKMVAEGVKTSRAVVELAAGAGVETPIADEVAAALHEGKKATDILADLMQRRMRPELDGISPGGDRERLDHGAVRSTR
jgi:glycerol-3-phosphate dehydrogenase (NAD(P)+)